VHRTAAIKSLKQFRIPIKLLNLITLTLQNATAQVGVNNYLTEAIDINTGVRQGDPLSALLFSMVIDAVMKNLDIRGNIYTRLRQICVYADDMLILARARQAMMDTFIKLKNEATESG
jgi:porphobilinogen deaminase